jgi:hypothetical protein
VYSVVGAGSADEDSGAGSITDDPLAGLSGISDAVDPVDPSVEAGVEAQPPRSTADAAITISNILFIPDRSRQLHLA